MIPETAERGYVRLIGVTGTTGNDLRPGSRVHLRVCCELAPVALWSCAAARSGAVVMLLVAVHPSGSATNFCQGSGQRAQSTPPARRYRCTCPAVSAERLCII